MALTRCALAAVLVAGRLGACRAMRAPEWEADFRDVDGLTARFVRYLIALDFPGVLAMDDEDFEFDWNNNQRGLWVEHEFPMKNKMTAQGRDILTFSGVEVPESAKDIYRRVLVYLLQVMGAYEKGTSEEFTKLFTDQCNDLYDNSQFVGIKLENLNRNGPVTMPPQRMFQCQKIRLSLLKAAGTLSSVADEWHIGTLLFILAFVPEATVEQKVKTAAKLRPLVAKVTAHSEVVEKAKRIAMQAAGVLPCGEALMIRDVNKALKRALDKNYKWKLGKAKLGKAKKSDTSAPESGRPLFWNLEEGQR